MDVGLSGQRAVVTGGTRGIGAAIVGLLVREGVSVVAAARSEPDALPAGARFLRADVATADGVADLARGSLDLLGGVDIVVSNAGGQRFRSGGALELTDEDYQADLDSNLMAAVRLDRALLPSMIARGSGSIIHIGSGAARIARPQWLAYSAAKAALTAYSKGLAIEVGRRGVRVNVVHPGVIRTDRLERRVAESAEKEGIDEETVVAGMVEQFQIPLGRIGAADEVAALVLFLASPAGAYITGSQLTVDGGAMPTV